MNIKNTIYSFLTLAIIGLSSCGNIEENTSTIESTSTIMEIHDGWKFKSVKEDQWLPAEVPGCVHTDLLANKKIEDPHFGMNETKLQWIDRKDWEYQTQFEFNKSKQNQELVFDGLDTWAEVYLNDKKIIEANNMHRQWKVDCSNELNEGTNTLKVVFRSPIKEEQKIRNSREVKLYSDQDVATRGGLDEEEKLVMYSRKAPYHHGWDWGPRLVTSGIYRSVRLEQWDQFRIKSIFYRTKSISEDRADLSVTIEIEADKNQTINGEIRNKETNEVLAELNQKLQKGINVIELDFAVNDPKLWWSNGLGEPYLYDLVANVSADGYSEKLAKKVGIRTIRLVSEKDEIGRGYYFELNGQKVFIKGANYIPQDNFLTRVTDEKYKKTLHAAKDANMNCMRVWGGGTYEKDIFYDLCDELGLLVFQDFMFGCAHYPGHDKEFMENVKKEAIENIKRLRGHACLANWCGNNEMEWMNKNWYRKFYAPEDTAFVAQGQRNIFFDLLPKLVAEYDPGRSYVPSSPYTPDGKINSKTHGDVHDWSVFHVNKPVEYYKSHIGRFMSEYGMQSFPEMKTIKAFATEADYDPHSEVMELHQKTIGKDGNAIIEDYNDARHKKPNSFESFVYLTQQTQAYGISLAIESFRRAKPYCMGSIFWQFNDCWPGMSWSSYDYFGRWKALLYKVKKAYAPVLVSPDLTDDKVTVHIVSDLPKEQTFDLNLELYSLGGKKLWSQTSSQELKADESKQVFESTLSDLLQKSPEQLNSTNSVLYVSITQNGELVSDNTLLFEKEKNLQLSEMDIQYEISEKEGQKVLTLTDDSFVNYLQVDFPDYEVSYSDNYFDLIPGKTKEVILQTEGSIADLKSNIKFKAVNNAYDMNLYTTGN